MAAVTAGGLFDRLQTRSTTRSPASGQSPGAQGLFASARDVNDARQAITDLGQVFGSSNEVAALGQQLLLAESDPLPDDQRGVVLGGIAQATDRIRHVVSLPPSTSITLTSSVGQVPITILATGSSHPHVELVLTSQHLIFTRFTPRNGTCTVRSESTEVCDLTLESQNTTLKVPVQARSSGVSPLYVYLYPPGTPPGSRNPLAYDQDTVRSTAVSGAAVILIIVALLALVLWWGRDLRRGRRPKGMVPSPLATATSSGDPQVDSFFERDPPAMSPSGGGGGPMAETDIYGPPGREMRR